MGWVVLSQHLPRVAPVTEAPRVAVGATGSDDEGEQDDANDDDYLETRQPELELAEEADAEVVDGHDDEQEYGDPDAGIYSVAGYPILYDESRGRELVGRDNYVFAPITGKKRERMLASHPLQILVL